MDGHSSSVNSPLIENQRREKFFKNFERELEEVFKTLQNTLQNVRTVDQYDRFIEIFKFVIINYSDTLKKKIDKLEKFAKSHIEKNLGNANVAGSITNQGEEAILQNKDFLIEMNKKADEIEKGKTEIDKDIAMFRQLNTIFEQKKVEIAQQFRQIIANLQQQRNNGLTQEEIKRFQLFTADDTHVGDQCSICMGNVVVGKLMRRLTCDGQHYFCKNCIDDWLADHNTCPLCRHAFV